MESDAEEQKRLRSVAIQNANAILLVRQRAERELLAAKEALEKKSEELAHSLAMMRATLESTTDGILVTNADGEVTGFNQKYVEMWRIPPELMQAKQHRQLLEATSRQFTDPAAFRGRIEEIYASSPPETYDLLEVADGRVIERFSKTQWVEERNVGRVWSFRDVTGRKHAEIELRRSYEAEQEARAAAEKANQAKDHFIAALSHELRTPLTPVLAILSSLRQETAPAALAEDLETIRRNVELEARLIDDLLDLTRISRGKLHLHNERIPAGRIIEDAINTCLADLKAGSLTLVRELVEPAPTVHVDSARVTQILWNLLKNAIKFTPPEGTITVRSRLAESNGARQFILEVQDTGLGIEADNAERIFQAFEQGDQHITRQFGGLGLGLAISKAIAEAHGGGLSASSAGKGCGSTFKLTLPCAQPEAPELAGSSSAGDTLAPDAPDAPVSLQRSLRILLVEDHVDTAAILSRLLRRMGHEVLYANSVQQAIETADREIRNGGIDLLMSDLGLPDGSGQDLIRTLSTNYRLKAIALSGYGMDSDVEQSSAAGFARHLIKPINVALLRSTIAELMHD